MVGSGWAARSEFWSMHPTELWWLIEAKQPPKMYGGMPEHEMAEIYADLKAKGAL